MKNIRGFTLIEAMVTVAILAIFASLAIPSFQGTIIRSKVRKTADLLSQTIVVAKSDALRNNRKTYLEKIGTNLCIGTADGLCDIRSEPLVNGVDVSNTKLILSPFYGIPSPSPATFTVSYSGVTQSVTVNMLGIVIVGPLS